MTGVTLGYMTDYKLRLVLKNNMRGGPSSCMFNRYVKRGERKIVYENMNNLFGWSTSQYSPNGNFCEINVTRSSLQTILGTPDNDDFDFLINCDLEYPFSIHEKTKFFPFGRARKALN